MSVTDDSTVTRVVDPNVTITSEIVPFIPELKPGEELGPYRIIERIGRGGMGIVYRAEVVKPAKLPTGTLVAVKMLRLADINNINRRRFEREAAYLLALNHPGIVKLYELNEYNGLPFLVMELVEGRNLDDLMPNPEREELLPEDHICDIMVQALEALHTAHLAGIMHRDLKPGNLMISPEGRVMILDFGMAQRRQEESRLTASGSVLGTPAYMSPEQARGQRARIDHRSDIYSMGAVLYELTTGLQPFRAPNSMALLRAILDEPLTPPSRLRPNLSRDLETVIFRAMAKDIRDRYANAEQMAADLRRISRGERIRSTRPSHLKIILRKLYFHRRRLLIVGMATFFVAFASALGIRSIFKAMDARRQRDQQRIDSLTDLLEARWLEAWRLDGPADISERLHDETDPDWSRILRVLRPYDHRGDPLRIPSAIGLTVEVHLTGDKPEAHIYFSSSGIGRGYGLVISRSSEQDNTLVMSLTRHREVLRAQPDAIIAKSVDITDPPNGVLHLAIRREGNVIEAFIGNRPILRFEDLIPLDGPDFNRVYFAYAEEATSFANITIRRQARPEFVNRLELADVAYFDGNYDRAINLYQDYLEDGHKDELKTAARYRIARCRFAKEDWTAAMQAFDAVAGLGHDTPYYLPSVFQAWVSALQLKEKELEATGRYYQVIKQEDIQVLLSSMPENLIKDVPRNYIDFGNDVVRGSADAMEAMRGKELYESAVDVALFLRQPRLVVEGKLHLADLYLGQGDTAEPKTIYQDILEDETTDIDDRIHTRCRLAELYRLEGCPEEAEVKYREAIEQGRKRRDPREYAILWLGDLLAAQGRREEAITMWKGIANNRNTPQRCAAYLLDHRVKLEDPKDKEDYLGNDVLYFRAMSDRQRGGDGVVFLKDCVRQGMPFEWPALLAQHLLALTDEP